ncbi:hypothetical protein ATY43_01445 [Xanthomonas oryzae pv. oryzae]|nr:hypothetical protein ATY43_01445 [Xanthomonas oryzae pv. oryzae]AOS09194.1 hypothetical protein ATY44_01420 [Xanthomonas oryzae pv. oryzae]AOS13376.1 hypothetical protein ATY45_01345 [Xanthomonas oryzae pv. oryzae]
MLQVIRLGNILGVDRRHGALTPVAIVLVQKHLAVEVTLDTRKVIYRPRNLGRAQLGMLPYVVQAVFEQPALLCAMCAVDEPANSIDLFDQLFRTQARRPDAVCWIKQLEVSKVAIKVLQRRVLGEEADVVSLVV